MNKNYLIIGLIILALIVIGVIAARPGDEELPGENNGTEEGTDGTNEGTEASVTVDDQEVSENNEVVIENVDAMENGFIVIHRADESGAPGDIIGSAPVDAGSNPGVVVELSEDVEAGETLVAMLHIDSNDNDQFEFSAENADVDTPVVVDDTVVAELFTVEVADAEAEAGAETEAETDAAAE